MISTRRAQSSKRRWIARAKAGKWVPKEVVFVLDQDQDWFERWEPHPTERGFLRLRGSTPATFAEGQKDQ